MDAHALKREWYRWIDCATEKGVFLMGQPATKSMDKITMSVTFLDQRLVLIDYLFDVESPDQLLRAFVSHYGLPNSTVRHPPGESKYASWTRGNSRVEFEQLAIPARVEGAGTLRIEKNSSAIGVRIRIASSTSELSGELQEQDNLGDLILPQ